MLPFATLCFVILLPIIPAYLLFKALPATGSVEGKLQGLEVKLGGAFAGYFALVLLILANHSILMPPASYQVWQVSGRILDEHGRPIDPLDQKYITVDPTDLHLQPGGRFTLSFYSYPDINNTYAYPTLYLGSDDQVVEIPLDPSKVAPHPPSESAAPTVSGRAIDVHDVTLPAPTAYPTNLKPLNGPAPAAPAGGANEPK